MMRPSKRGWNHRRGGGGGPPQARNRQPGPTNVVNHNIGTVVSTELNPSYREKQQQVRDTSNLVEIPTTHIPSETSSEANTATDAVPDIIGGPGDGEMQESNLLGPLKVDCNSQLTKALTSYVSSTDYWHKFIVLEGAALDKFLVMNTVINWLYRTEFIPVLYQTEGPHFTFLARACTMTIKKLFSSNFSMLVEGWTTPERMVKVEIILCFAHIRTLELSIKESLMQCVEKRFNSDTRTLDLSDFVNDPDLVDLIYCPLWSQKVFSHILVHSKLLKPINYLYLNKNGLRSFHLLHIHGKIGPLKMLNLADNQLANIFILKDFQKMNLMELILDNNPLCSQYSSKESYVREVQAILPSLKKLDGVLLCEPDMPCWYRNYLDNPQGASLINQFLENFFTIFDSDNRQSLKGVYHQEACFSMSAIYLPEQSTSSEARMTRYTVESRNLLKISDYTKSFKLISHGPERIVAALCRLPKVEHDPVSFCVDVPQYSENIIVITVTGVFKEPSTINQALLRFFKRTFVLVRIGNSQYQISNDILFISNATTRQAKESFRLSRPPPNLTQMALSAYKLLTDADRQNMTDCMADLTKMSHRWAKKCLEESKWNFQEALQVFTELLKMDKIPVEAFVKT